MYAIVPGAGLLNSSKIIHLYSKTLHFQALGVLVPLVHRFRIGIWLTVQAGGMKKQHYLIGNISVWFNRQLLVIFSLVSMILSVLPAASQTAEEKDAAFRKVLTERSAKIVSALDITKAGKNNKITAIIANQYYDLNKVHDNVQDEAAKAVQLQSLHDKFVAKLNGKLKKEQVEKVKNGMTYNVLNVTYTAYQDMILTLTAEQKEKIYNWLLEAREKAMMEGSSDDKHKMFGKYKGKINNYLSQQGYDMKAEEKAWQQRLREKREKEAATKKSQGA